MFGAETLFYSLCLFPVRVEGAGGWRKRMETLSILIRLEGENKYAMLLVIVNRNLIYTFSDKKKEKKKSYDSR